MDDIGVEQRQESDFATAGGEALRDRVRDYSAKAATTETMAASVSGIRKPAGT